MKKFYHLSTCNTCQRIFNDLQLSSSFEKRDIKQQEITVKELEGMKQLAGSYEALFSKRAKLYKERDLKNEILTENDYKSFILEHYTFLKRPVLIDGDTIFIGNSKKVVEAAKEHLAKKK